MEVVPEELEFESSVGSDLGRSKVTRKQDYGVNDSGY